MKKEILKLLWVTVGICLVVGCSSIIGNKYVFAEEMNVPEGGGGYSAPKPKPTIHQHRIAYHLDSYSHEKYCTECGLTLDERAHSFNSRGECECGYNKPIQTVSPKTPSPTDCPHTGAKAKAKNTGSDKTHDIVRYCSLCQKWLNTIQSKVNHKFDSVTGLCECGYKQGGTSAPKGSTTPSSSSSSKPSSTKTTPSGGTATKTNAPSGPTTTKSSSGKEGSGGIELLQKELKLFIGTQYRISAKKDSPPVKVWTSTDSKVAAVNQEGVVTGKKPGSCTIIAMGAGGLAFCDVIVLDSDKKEPTELKTLTAEQRKELEKQYSELGDIWLPDTTQGATKPGESTAGSTTAKAGSSNTPKPSGSPSSSPKATSGSKEGGSSKDSVKDQQGSSSDKTESGPTISQKSSSGGTTTTAPIATTAKPSSDVHSISSNGFEIEGPSKIKVGERATYRIVKYPSEYSANEVALAVTNYDTVTIKSGAGTSAIVIEGKTQGSTTIKVVAKNRPADCEMLVTVENAPVDTKAPTSTESGKQSEQQGTSQPTYTSVPSQQGGTDQPTYTSVPSQQGGTDQPTYTSVPSQQGGASQLPYTTAPSQQGGPDQPGGTQSPTASTPTPGSPSVSSTPKPEGAQPVVVTPPPITPEGTTTVYEPVSSTGEYKVTGDKTLYVGEYGFISFYIDGNVVGSLGQTNIYCKASEAGFIDLLGLDCVVDMEQNTTVIRIILKGLKATNKPITFVCYPEFGTQMSTTINVINRDGAAPQRTQSAINTPQPTKSSVLTATLKPGATAEPTATPKPGTTAEPTATPKPGTTAEPTATPRPGTTAIPIATPTPGTTIEPIPTQQSENPDVLDPEIVPTQIPEQTKKPSGPPYNGEGIPTVYVGKNIVGRVFIDSGNYKSINPQVVGTKANYTVSMEIEDTRIASIEDDGSIRGKLPGRTTLNITYNFEDGSVETQQCTLVCQSVTKQIELLPTSCTMYRGEQKILNIYGATINDHLLFYSTNPRVAMSKGDGTIVGLGSGTCDIYAILGEITSNSVRVTVY